MVGFVGLAEVLSEPGFSNISHELLQKVSDDTRSRHSHQKEVVKMNKKFALISLVLGVSLLFLTSITFAGNDIPNEWRIAVQGMSPYTGESMGTTVAPQRWNSFEASWLIGHGVFSPTGTYLGQISDFVIDQGNDRIALVILSDVPGIGAEKIAVPYSALIRTGDNTFQFSFGDRGPDITVSNYVDPYAATLAMPPAGSELYGVPATMNPRWVEDIYRHYGHVPYWTEKGEKSIAAANLYRYSALRDKQVESPQGQDVARVDDLIISPRGYIVFLGLSDVSGQSGQRVAVPFSLLSKRGEDTFTLNVGKEKLASAPSFSHYAEMNSHLRRAENSYRYFGVRPSWIH
jgi:sporulation protein YlmC with PRC-barrel domain